MVSHTYGRFTLGTPRAIPLYMNANTAPAAIKSNLQALRAVLSRGNTEDRGALGLRYSSRYEAPARDVAALVAALGGTVSIRKVGKMVMPPAPGGSASQPWKVDLDLGSDFETYLLGGCSLDAVLRWTGNA